MIRVEFPDAAGGGRGFALRCHVLSSIDKCGFFLGRQTSLEELGFESGKIGRRMFAEAELHTASLLPRGELMTQVVPMLPITELKGLDEKALQVGRSGRQHTNRATDDQSGNGSFAPRSTAFMPAGRPKTRLQVIIGARQPRPIIG